MSRRPASFGSPKLRVVDRGDKGKGVVAAAPIARAEIVGVFGGDVVHSDEIPSLTPAERRLVLQIDDDYYLLSAAAGVPDYINHACTPNLGLRGPITLVALRDIDAGEEVCFDYAMSDGCDYDSFDCACGSSACRGRVTGADWRDPLLWRRYRGHFSPYLQRRIDALRGRERRARRAR